MDRFEHHRDRGLAERAAGCWAAARRHLLEAAGVMAGRARQADTPDLRDARGRAAERLLDLARDCEAAERDGRRPTGSGSSGSRPGTARPGTARPGTARPGGSNASPSAETHAGDGADLPDASRWLVRERPDVTFEDVAGLEDVKHEIRLKALYALRHPEASARWGVRAGGGVLLYGPPGTGKTLIARATAGELDAAFFAVTAGDLMSKWVGDAERNVQALFAAAAEVGTPDGVAPPSAAVIFIDEIDALAPARREDAAGGGGGVMGRVVPQLLASMEGFARPNVRPVLVLAATNVPWNLDPALLRPGRFDRLIHVGLPDFPARRRLLELLLATRPLANDVDLDDWAGRLEGYSGADLRAFAEYAARVPFLREIAGGEPGEITDVLLRQTAATLRPSVSPAAVRRFEAWVNAG